MKCRLYLRFVRFYIKTFRETIIERGTIYLLRIWVHMSKTSEIPTLLAQAKLDKEELTYSNEFWKLPQLWTKVRKFRTEYGLLWGHCYELFVCGDLNWISRNTWRDIHRIWIFYRLKKSILHEVTEIELK